MTTVFDAVSAILVIVFATAAAGVFYTFPGWVFGALRARFTDASPPAWLTTRTRRYSLWLVACAATLAFSADTMNSGFGDSTTATVAFGVLAQYAAYVIGVARGAAKRARHEPAPGTSTVGSDNPILLQPAQPVATPAVTVAVSAPSDGFSEVIE